MKSRLVLLSAALSTTTWLTPAFAQASIADNGGRSKSKGLEEIIVTAQRRSQKLQSVPVAVTAFSAKTLTRTGITKTQDVQQVDSSLVISTGSGINAPYIRGVGNASATGLGNEASVPIYIDDVYYSRLNAVYLELANVDSIQVLKGPQGTLFGRNSSGGAILITTRDPGTTWHANGEVGYANYNTFTGKLYAAGPINDWIGAGLSVSGQHQGTGWGQNVNTGQPTYRSTFINIRGKIVARPTTTTKVTLSAFYAQADSGQGSFNSIYGGTVSGIPALPGNPYGGPGPVYPTSNFYDTNNTYNSNIYTRGLGGALKIEQDLGLAQFVSITSFRAAREHYYSTGALGPYDYNNYELYQYDREATQEVQFKSEKTSKVDWIVGAFFLDSRVGYDPTKIHGDAISASGLSNFNIYGQETIKSYSGYGQATVPIFSDRNHLTGGVRYSFDNVHGVGYETGEINGFGTFPIPGSAINEVTPFKKFTYKVSLDHKFTDNILGYFSYSRGYKSGTYNLLPISDAPTKPEVVDAYELGVKSTILDNRVRLNAAIFENDISDPQVEIAITGSNGTFVGLTNAGGAKVQGVEFNADARVTDELTLRAGATYLNAYYTAFVDAPYYREAGAPNYGTVLSSEDATGNRIAQVPKWRFTTGANYDVDTRVGHINMDANLAYTGKFDWTPDNLLTQKSYFILNATATYSPSSDAKWFVRAFGQNLLGAKYTTALLQEQGTEGDTSSPGAPRQYGVVVGFNF